MWCHAIITLSVAISAAQSSNFFKNFGVFDIEHGHSLDGHVIKTLPLFKADCMATCKETISCFSINTYKDQHGNDMCDLNRSTKKQSPKSFTKREGYDYSEPSKGEFCLKNDCPTKEALADNWYKFNTSSFKYFINTTNWDDAQEHCQKQGGDLASFSSKTENEFVLETMLHERSASDNGWLARSILDETDATLRLTGAVHFVNKDSKPAVSFDGASYIEIPRFDLHDTDFTIAVNIYPRTGSLSGKLLEGFSGSSSFVLGVKIDSWTSISLSTSNSYLEAYVGCTAVQTWTQIAITWNHATGTIKPQINSGSSSSSSSTSPSPKWFKATDPYYRVGEGFDGWMSNMVVVSRILTSQEINDLINGVSSIVTQPSPSIHQGAWVGLNDKAAEGTVQWSDGLPLTYKPNEDLGNSEGKDCGLLIKMNGDRSAWKTEVCQGKATAYICKKKG